MKKSKKLLVTLFATTIFCTSFVAVANEYGSKEDPLVSLSYINDVLVPETLEDVNALISTKTDNYLSEISKNASSYSTEFSNLKNNDEFIDKVADKVSSIKTTEYITLSAGQKITLYSGSEIIVRSGSGSFNSCFLNATTGTTTLSNTSSALNNLYLAVDEGAVYTSSSASTVLITGAYKK